jgi:hypothetical protein
MVRACGAIESPPTLVFNQDGRLSNTLKLLRLWDGENRSNVYQRISRNGRPEGRDHLLLLVRMIIPSVAPGDYLVVRRTLR